MGSADDAMAGYTGDAGEKLSHSEWMTAWRHEFSAGGDRL